MASDREPLLSGRLSASRPPYLILFTLFLTRKSKLIQTVSHAVVVDSPGLLLAYPPSAPRTLVNLPKGHQIYLCRPLHKTNTSTRNGSCPRPILLETLQHSSSSRRGSQECKHTRPGINAEKVNALPLTLQTPSNNTQTSRQLARARTPKKQTLPHLGLCHLHIHHPDRRRRRDCLVASQAQLAPDSRTVSQRQIFGVSLHSIRFTWRSWAFEIWRYTRRASRAALSALVDSLYSIDGKTRITHIYATSIGSVQDQYT